MDFTGSVEKLDLRYHRRSEENSRSLKIAISPKYRIDNLGEFSPLLQNIRPWIIPIGMAFLLSSANLGFCRLVRQSAEPSVRGFSTCYGRGGSPWVLLRATISSAKTETGSKRIISP